MIAIDRLSLRLPAGFEGRATSIANALASALLPLAALGPVTFDRLTLAPVRVGPATSDGEIAVAVACEVLRGMKAER